MNLQNAKVFGFRIYGDNIDECLKFAKIIEKVAPSLGLKLLRVDRPYFSPIYLFQAIDRPPGLENKILAFQICGRYGEWQEGRFPFLGYEDTDVILTSVKSEGGVGKPILALEFNDAIPAGNNAWQRFPRIAHSAQYKVPFIYSIPICDAEVKDGIIKSIRHPNITIVLGQLILMAKFGVASLTIYGESPWYLDALETNLATKEVTGVNDESRVGKFSILEVLHSIEGKVNSGKFSSWLKEERKKIFEECMNDMLIQASHFIHSDFSLLSNHKLIDKNRRDEIIKTFWESLEENKEIPEDYKFYDWDISLIKKNSERFSKATSTSSIFMDKLNPNLRFLSSESEESLRVFSKRWGVEIPRGADKSKIEEILSRYEEKWKYPISYKPPVNELAFIFQPHIFADLLEETYKKLDKNIIERCRKAHPPILFVPLAGYVEDSGGVIAFSRPDKGFISLVSTLFSQTTTFSEKIVLMYHQEIPNAWKEELKRAVDEEKGHKVERDPNNLWRMTARFATIVIIDYLQEGFIL